VSTFLVALHGLGLLGRRGIGFNLAKTMIQLRGFLVHPLPIVWTCVMLRTGLPMEDLLVAFQRSDALLDAAQLFCEYTEVVLIASLLRVFNRASASAARKQ
jgi:hypothetical protein